MASRQLTEFRPPTDQERRFAEEYLYDLDPKAAALRAGYDAQVAAGAHLSLLREPQIITEIARLKESRAIRTGIGADRVLLEIARAATYDPADLFDEDGRMLPLKDIPEDTRRSISSFKMAADGSVEVKFVTKLDATKQFMDHVKPLGVGAGVGKSNNDQKLIALFHEILSAAKSRPLPPSAAGRGLGASRTVVAVTIEDETGEMDVTPETPSGRTDH